MVKSDDKTTPIYAFYPANNFDPYLIIRKTRKCGISDYKLLPWPLEALPNTIWCNINTGDRERIFKIDKNRWGNLDLITENNEYRKYSNIGFWRDNKYCIDDWVRIDHLPPSSQLAWFCYEIDYLRRTVKQERTSEEIANYAYFRKLIEDLAFAISYARTFALAHNLPVPSGLSTIHTFSKKHTVDFTHTVDINKEGGNAHNVYLSFDEINQSTVSQLTTLLKEADKIFQLAVPCGSIGITNNPLDIANDYLEVLFVGETLADYCDEISIKDNRYLENQYDVSVIFIFRPRDVTELAKSLILLSHGFSDPSEYWKSQAKNFPEGWFPDDPYATPESLEYRENVLEFEAELEERALRFPELADTFLANYIHGDGPVLDTVAYPEYKYMFWKSFLSKRVGFDFYVSSELWILPLEINVESLLVEHGGFRFGVPDLYEAIPLTMGNLIPIVYHKYCVAGYPIEEITRAQKCAEEVFSDRLRKDYEDVPLNIINQILLDKERSLLIASDQIAHYVCFGDCLPGVSPSILRIILENLPILSSLTGEQISISCPWNKMNDDQFEELCYDMVLSHYHPTRIAKMGKSRSRDGGRDIIFETARLGKPPESWIVQCKLIRDGGSLTSRKVEVSDTIAKYGANGYCVMTTGVIDATLQEKLEGIKRNSNNFEYETWSRLEMERFLARHLDIVHRYFPSLDTRGKEV